MRSRVLPVLLAAWAAALPGSISRFPEASDAPWSAPTVDARAGEPVRFYCIAYSPCQWIVFHAPEGGARGFRLTVDAGLSGGYGVRAEGLRGVPPEKAYLQMGDDAWGLGGYGFGAAQGQTFEQEVPLGTAQTWVVVFSPMSGETGGEVTVALVWL